MPLFIGGPLDGRLIEIDPKLDHVEVAIEHPMAVVADPVKEPSKLTDIFYYKKQILDCPSSKFPVFVPRSFTCEQVLYSLIDGYHQGAIQNSEH